VLAEAVRDFHGEVGPDRVRRVLLHAVEHTSPDAGRAAVAFLTGLAALGKGAAPGHVQEALEELESDEDLRLDIPLLGQHISEMRAECADRSFLGPSAPAVGQGLTLLRPQRRGRCLALAVVGTGVALLAGVMWRAAHAGRAPLSAQSSRELA